MSVTLFSNSMLRGLIVIAFGLLFVRGMAAQDSGRSPTEKLLITVGSLMVDSSDQSWVAARQQLDSLGAQWRTLAPKRTQLTSRVDEALSAAARVVAAPSPQPLEASSALSRLATAVDEYVSAATGAAPANTNAAQIQSLLEIARKSLDFVQKGDAPSAVVHLLLFSSEWVRAEAGIRTQNPTTYAAIEIDSARAGAALRASPPDMELAKEALRGLVNAIEGYGAGVSIPQNKPAVPGKVEAHNVDDLVALLRQSSRELESGDQAAASATMQRFMELWPAAEGVVMARSQDAYTNVENEMTETGALLLSANADRTRAAALIQDMAERLERVSVRNSYNIWDSAVILLREGMEALLVLAALLALLKKSERQGSEGWVWAGAGTGLLLSVILAVILGLVISRAAGGTAREAVEGFVGIASVALMLTVGAWLHQRSSLQSWNLFLKSKVGGALAKGSMWSVFALAFLAVLREGAEAVVFYAGIAPAISPLALFGGIAGALVLLVIIGYLIIRFSVKLPLHSFFLVATVLIYYLAFKIPGESIHALQVVGTLPSHFQARLPTAGFLGMFPTWETLVPQLVILLLVLTEVVSTEARRMRARR